MAVAVSTGSRSTVLLIFHYQVYFCKNVKNIKIKKFDFGDAVLLCDLIFNFPI
jgi:hypothetical protein